MKILFEIGSYDGSVSLKYHTFKYKVFTFEQNKELYESLVNKTKHLENYHVYNKIIGLKDNDETMRLDTFIEKTNLQNVITDYIYINSQYNNLNVLKSMGIYIKNLDKGYILTLKNKDENNINVDINEDIYSNVDTFLCSIDFDIHLVEDSHKCILYSDVYFYNLNLR